MSGTRRKTSQSFVDPMEVGRETIHSLSKKARKAVTEEAKMTGQEFWGQLLGYKDKKTEAETQVATPTVEAETQSGVFEREIVSFLHKQDVQHATERAPKAEAAINYHREIVTTRERSTKTETQQMQQTVEQIKVELSRLVANSQVLKMEFAEVSVEQTTHNVGHYHLNFLEWMLAVIRSAREKVEDSGAWLNTVQGKGKKGWGTKERKAWFGNTSVSLGNESGGGVINQTG